MQAARGRRARWLLLAATGCLLAVGALIVLAWLEVTLTPPDQCASMSCQDIWLFPVFIGPWFLIGAVVLFIVGVVELRKSRVGRELESVTLGPGRVILASPSLRIVGGLVDLIAISLLWSFVGGTVVTIAGPATASPGWPGAAAALFSLIGPLGYFTYFWSSQGQTAGLALFGFRVLDASTGRYPSWQRALARASVWLLELLATPFGIGAVGWLWPLWDNRKQALHDKVAGTIVTDSKLSLK